MSKSLAKIVEGDVVLPYRGDKPIMLFNNEQNNDTFIRIRKHPKLDVWYSEVDETCIGDAVPRDPHLFKSQGAVVFLTAQQLSVGTGIRIVRVLKDGNSARGTVLELPAGVKFPYEADTAKLFKSIP